MKAKIYFSNKTLERDFIIDDFSYTEIYHNNLNPADNSAQLSFLFDTELSETLKTHDKEDIKIEIKNNDNTNFLTGFIRKNYKFTKTQRNQPINIEIVNPSYLLKKETNELICLTNSTVSSIIINLLNRAGFTDIGNIGISNQLPIFYLEKGANIYDTIKELCFEYGYIFDFDKDGKFNTYPLFNAPSLPIAQIFNGSNCLENIIQSKKEEEPTNILAKWKTVEYRNNMLIFSDTQNNDKAHTCKIEIPPNSFLFGEEYNYFEYDYTQGDLIYIDTINKTDFKFSAGVELLSITNLGKKANVSIKNEGAGGGLISRLDIYGSGFVETATNETKTNDSDKNKEYEVKYIFTKELANDFVKRLSDYYKYSDFTVSTKSRSNYLLGSFVSITDTGIGTINGRIIQKKYTLNSVCL